MGLSDLVIKNDFCWRARYVPDRYHNWQVKEQQNMENKNSVQLDLVCQTGSKPEREREGGIQRKGKRKEKRKKDREVLRFAERYGYNDLPLTASLSPVFHQLSTMPSCYRPISILLHLLGQSTKLPFNNWVHCLDSTHNVICGYTVYKLTKGTMSSLTVLLKGLHRLIHVDI